MTPPRCRPRGQIARAGRRSRSDVNETLSDLSPLAGRFEDVGAPGHLARTWFAGLLRDGFALAAVEVSASFAGIAAEALRINRDALS